MKKGLFFLAFCIICPEVFAGVFSVIPTDKSQQYLGMIFGGSVGAVALGGGVNNPTLSYMMEQYNFIIVTIGAIVLSYIGIASTINTAREGEALGKKFSLWTPLRAFLGMLLMVPGPSSGYSVVQMTVIWIVLNGVGAANSIWNVVLSQLSRGVSVAQGVNIQIQPSQLNNLTQNILQSSACMYSINNYMPVLNAAPGPFKNNGPIRIYTVAGNPVMQPTTGTPSSLTQNSTIYIGLQGDPNYFSVCGMYTITVNLNSGDPNNSFNLAALSQRLSIKTSAVQAMFNAVDTIAQLAANPATSSAQIDTFDKGYVRASGQAYISQITQLATGVKAALASNANPWEQNAPTNAITGNFEALKSYGWIQAGSYYYTMVQASGAQIDNEAIWGKFVQPTPTNVPQPPQLNNGNVVGSWLTNAAGGQSNVASLLQSTVYNQYLSTALSNANYYWASDNATPEPPSQGISTGNPDTGNKFMNAVVGGIASAIRTPILEYIANIAKGNGGDPLLSMGQFGTRLMLAGELSVFAALVTSIAVSLISSSGSCLSPLAWGVNLILVQLLPLIYGAALMMWTGGATLGVYIPMVPYLIFTTSAFGWMIAVVEAVVGAPLIALGLTHPSGEELGKVTSGLTILANLFLRPTLMIFGFVLGASLLKAGLALINFGFIPALNQGTSATIFSIIAVLGMYVFLVMALVNKSFSLIYMLPNQILRWMGGQSESFDPGDMVKEAKGGFDAGASKGQALGEEGFKAGTDRMKASVKARDDRLQKLKDESEKKKKAGELPSAPA